MTRCRSLSLLLLLAMPAARADRDPFEVEVRELRGFEIHVTTALLEGEPELAASALEVLDAALLDIERRVPAAAVERLRDVAIWLSEEDEQGRHPCACYHPSVEWLKANGYDPRKAKSVDLANARNFVDWTIEQPFMVLHELAHAYHHQVLGHDHAELNAAFEAAREEGAYDEVLRYTGRTEKHYAMNNVQEYFAEATEAYFGTNDYFPFVRAELERHDPRLFALMDGLWMAED